MSLTRKQLEAPLQEIAKQLDGLLREIHDERCGFILLTFDFSAKGHVAYVTNAQRAGAIGVLKEVLARWEVGLATDPPGPGSEA